MGTREVGSQEVCEGVNSPQPSDKVTGASTFGTATPSPAGLCFGSRRKNMRSNMAILYQRTGHH